MPGEHTGRPRGRARLRKGPTRPRGAARTRSSSKSGRSPASTGGSKARAVPPQSRLRDSAADRQRYHRVAQPLRGPGNASRTESGPTSRSRRSCHS
jgi:hypothetical protein